MKKGISHEARAKLMLNLRDFQRESRRVYAYSSQPALGVESSGTQKVVDDLVISGMIYGDYL